MFLSNWKEWMIASATALGIFCLYALGGAWHKERTAPAMSESYEMVRAKDSFWGRFDLSNREVEYKRTGMRPVEPQKQVAAGPATKATAKVPPVPTAAAKDPKLAKAEAAKKAALAKKQAAAALAKKNGVSLRVVGGNSGGTISHDAQKSGIQQTGIYGAPPPQNPVAPPAQADDTQDNKLSPGQWYSLLQAQPTAANAKKFLEAKGQIGEKNYYDILLKLLRDSQADRQKIALSILNSDVSIGTFKFLVTAPVDLQKTEAVSSGTAAIIQSYGQDRSRFLVLAQALAASDPQVIIASQTIIQASVSAMPVAAASNNPSTGAVATSGSMTGQGGPRVTTLSKNDFNIFKAALAHLTKNSNQQIATNAKNIYVALWQQAPDVAVAGN
jgi:hypothetical protein